MKLGCVVMAAGSSRRFGRNKLLQEFCGKPLFQWALEAVPAGRFERVHVVTGYGPVAALAREQGFEAVCNNCPEAGVSHTIRLGLEGLLDCQGVLFMTADQPLLSGETICRLADVFQEHPSAILAASSQGKRGNPCLFPQDLFPALLKLEGDTGGSRVIKSHPDRLYLVEVPAQELADCDTAEALRVLEAGRT